MRARSAPPTTGRHLGVVAATVALLAACSAPADVPERDPDVTGTVALGADGGPVLVDASDRSYEGIRLLQDDPAVLRGDEAVDAADLTDGDRVEVWLAGGCAESWPPQCDVVAVRAP
ncbi:hypothetical protein AB6N23_02890 [Cellulomonas sp. 179-A 9B4 NHS]|uniref:hypothetical protein n=1 Tax=Cellulomonas sp. 179-A 9B4 NHS TaxID=3142379 RepID=UPI0039A20C36